MALPPERITVKRRRDEDPVEALYIQSKKARPSAVWTLQERVTPALLAGSTKQSDVGSSQGKRNSAAVPPLGDAPLSTAARSTKATNEEPVRHAKGVHLSQTPADASAQLKDIARAGARPVSDTPNPMPSEQGQTCGPPDLLQGPGPRRFHLSHDTFTSPNRRLSSSGSIRKHRPPRRAELAVFVEKGKRWIEKVHVQSLHGSQNGAGKDQGTNGRSSEVQPAARKRPNASAAEKVWRTETWGKPQKTQLAKGGYQTARTARETSSNWDDASLGLAHELQKLALQQSHNEEQVSQSKKGPAKLKFQPKPPKPRSSQSGAINEDRAKRLEAETNIGELYQDYVVDTYVRSSLQVIDRDEPSCEDLLPLPNLASSKIGILVIEAEEEEFWDAFADDEEDDREVGSDDEDENAEDFYGNDYPEDEVNTDDEYGRSAYKYRTNASDDEEYGEDDPEFSGSEDTYERWR